MRLVAVALLGVAACMENPSLRVDVTHERAPATTIVSVYESPTLTCEQVEFADYSEEELEALLVAEQTLGHDGRVLVGDLAGISRRDNKVIVARGYDDSATLLTAGCIDKGLVTENDSVAIDAVLIATVSIEPNDMADPYRLGILATDRDGRPIDRRRVAWRMYGPRGSRPFLEDFEEKIIRETGDGDWQPTRLACTRQNGTIGIHPITPDVVGGFAVSVRVSWAEQAPILHTSITGGTFVPSPLSLPSATKHPCAVRVKGGVKRLVCVANVGPLTVTNEYPVNIVGGRGVLGSPTRSPGQDFARPPVGLFSYPRPNGDVDVYSIDTSGELGNPFNSQSTTGINCPACASVVVDFRFGPACGPDPPRLFLKLTTSEVWTVPALGGTATRFTLDGSPTQFELNNAGCVTVTSLMAGNQARQVVVFNEGVVPGVTRGYYDCFSGPACATVKLPIGEGGVGFTTEGAPYLIGTAADATGLVLETWGIVPDPENPAEPRLVERASRIPTVARPNKIAVGSFDEDAQSDLIWDISSLRASGAAAFELAYGRPIGTGRLQAMSPSLDVKVTDMFVNEVTGDADDDIIIVGAFNAMPPSNTTPNGVVVIPTHVDVPVPTYVPAQCNN